MADTRGATPVDGTGLTRMFRRYGEQAVLLAAIAAIVGIASFYSPRVLSPANLQNILVQSSYLVIFASAQLVVIVARGFDLSLAPTVSTASVAAAMVMTAGLMPENMTLFAGIATAVGVGLLIGAFNGIAVGFGKVNPFLATLASMNVLLAVSTTISGGFPVSPLPREVAILSTGTVVGVPVPILVAAVVLCGLYIVLNSTVFGRWLYFVGANPDAARVAGIPVRRIQVVAYVICSLLIAVGAFMLTARTGSGEPNLGGNLTLEAIAAAVLGGASLRGGKGNVSAPVLGALLVTVLSNTMNLMVINGFLQQVSLGAIIIIALAIDRLRP